MFNGNKSPADSRSDSAAMLVLPSVRTKLVVRSLASSDTSKAALERVSRRYSRIYGCMSTEPVLASHEILHPGPVLVGTVQLFFARPAL